MSTALIVGAGRMARVRLDSLLSDERVDEVVVATRYPARAAELAERGARVLEIEQIADVEPTMAIVTSATADHVADVERVLTLGCATLCEKPLTDDAQVAHELAVRAAAAGTPLHVAFQRHFEPALRELRRRIAEDDLGAIFHVRFAHFDRHVQRRDYIPLSGGAFKDLLMHDIETALWLTQASVQWAFAAGAVRSRHDYADAGDFDCVTALLSMDNGIQVSINGMREHPIGHDVRVEVVGSEDALSVGLTRSSPLRALDAPGIFDHDPSQTFQTRFATAFADETRAFTAFALGITPQFDSTTAEVAAKALLVAEACERSLEEQRAVAPGEVP